MATIWRSPPERLPARWWERSASSGKSEVTAASRVDHASGRRNSPIRRFSSTVRRAEHVAALGHVADAECHQFVGRSAGDVLRLEGDRSGADRDQAE